MVEAASMATLRRSPPATLDIRIPGFSASLEQGVGVAKMQLLGLRPEEVLTELIGFAPGRGRQREDGGVTIAWLAPGEWLLIGREADLALRVPTLAAAGGSDALVVDLSHARASFLLGGAGSRGALAAHCPLDLWPDAFPVDTVARSLLGDAGVFVSRLTDGPEGDPRFRIIVDQTSAPYVARMLAGPRPRPGATT